MLAGPVDVAHAAHPLMIPVARRRSRHYRVRSRFPRSSGAHAGGDPPRLSPSSCRSTRSAPISSSPSRATPRHRQATALASPPTGSSCAVREHRPPPRRAEPKAVGPILFVGTIEPRKNLDVLFRAYARVLSKRPDAPPLLLAGRTVEQSASDSRTTIDRRLSPDMHDTSDTWMLVSTVALRRSVDAGHAVARRGFRHSGAGSDGRGRTGVASRRGALPEVVGDAGLLVDATDDVAFAAAIDALLPNRSGEWHRLKRAWRARASSPGRTARRSSWPHIAQPRASARRQGSLDGRDIAHPNPATADRRGRPRAAWVGDGRRSLSRRASAAMDGAKRPRSPAVRALLPRTAAAPSALRDGGPPGRDCRRQVTAWDVVGTDTSSPRGRQRSSRCLLRPGIYRAARIRHSPRVDDSRHRVRGPSGVVSSARAPAPALADATLLRSGLASSSRTRSFRDRRS